MTGAELIAAERTRQIEEEGWSARWDDKHHDGSLALVAACYATSAAGERLLTEYRLPNVVTYRDPWPRSWACHHDKRPRKGTVLRVPDDDEATLLLVKAGALIAAEIDRLQRLNVKEKP